MILQKSPSGLMENSGLINSKNAILHSDQGGTYTSPMYRDTAESYNLVLSYSRKGICYDNACIGNFYGHLKSETIYQLHITQRYCLRRKELTKIIKVTLLGTTMKESRQN